MKKTFALFLFNLLFVATAIGQTFSASQYTSSLNLDFTTGTLPSSLTFSRGSGATYFDNTGTLQLASSNQPRFDYDPTLPIVSGVLSNTYTNLVTNSNGFTLSFNPQFVSVSNNSTLSPQSTLTGSIISTTAISAISFNNTTGSTTIASGSTYTYSFYIKSLTQSGFSFNCYFGSQSSTGGSSDSFTFSSTGVLTTTGSATIRLISEGWYRIERTQTLTATISLLSPVFSGIPANVNFALWGLQIEPGSVANNYIATTNSAVTVNKPAKPKGILIEESRTNRFINSSNISLSTDHTFSNVTFPGTVTGPNNVANSAYTVLGGTGFCGVKNNNTYTYATASSYSVSIIVAPGTGNVISISVDNSAYIIYTLSGAGSYNVTNATNFSSANIKAIGSTGFYLCTLTITQKAANQNIWYVIPAGQSVAIFGIQEEDGSFPTSYIPTTSAAVTRAADYCSLLTVGWYNLNTSTVYCEYQFKQAGQPNTCVWCFDKNVANTDTGLEWVQYPGSDAYIGYVFKTDTSPYAQQYYPVNTTNISKSCVAWNGATIRYAQDNVLRNSQMWAYTLASDFVRLGINTQATHPYTGYIRKFIYYPNRLPDFYLQYLTN